MSHHAESVSIGKYESSIGDDHFSTAIDDLDEDLTDEELDAHAEESATTDCEEDHSAAPALPRMSYGLADVLLPMTPPKPKGARLVRGPLKFNMP